MSVGYSLTIASMIGSSTLFTYCTSQALLASLASAPSILNFFVILHDCYLFHTSYKYHLQSNNRIAYTYIGSRFFSYLSYDEQKVNEFVDLNDRKSKQRLKSYIPYSLRVRSMLVEAMYDACLPNLTPVAIAVWS